VSRFAATGTWWLVHRSDSAGWLLPEGGSGSSTFAGRAYEVRCTYLNRQHQSDNNKRQTQTQAKEDHHHHHQHLARGVRYEGRVRKKEKKTTNNSKNGWRQRKSFSLPTFRCTLFGHSALSSGSVPDQSRLPGSQKCLKCGNTCIIGRRGHLSVWIEH
jgi:hypothetical protein